MCAPADAERGAVCPSEEAGLTSNPVTAILVHWGGVSLGSVNSGMKSSCSKWCFLFFIITNENASRLRKHYMNDSISQCGCCMFLVSLSLQM